MWVDSFKSNVGVISGYDIWYDKMVCFNLRFLPSLISIYTWVLRTFLPRGKYRKLNKKVIIYVGIGYVVFSEGA